VTERAVLLTPMNRPHARTSKQEQRERTEYGAEHARVQPALWWRLAIGRASAVPLVKSPPDGLREDASDDPDANTEERQSRLLKVEAVVASEDDGEAVEEDVEQAEDEGCPEIEKEGLEGRKVGEWVGRRDVEGDRRRDVDKG
jgi:hypothetical protein